MNVLQIIIEIVLFFAEALMCSIFCNMFSNKRNEFGVRIIFETVISAMLIMLTNNFTEMFSPLNSLIILIILTILQFFIAKKVLFKLVLPVFVFRGVVTAVTYTVISLGHSFLGFNNNALSNNNVLFLQRDFPIFLSELILCLVILIIRRNAFNGNYFSRASKIIALTVSSLLFLICLIFPFLGIGDYYCFNFEYAYSNIIVITELVLVIIFDMVIIYYLLKPIISNLYVRQLELAEIKNNMLKNSLEETEQSFNLWKESIHDYKNNIIALTQLAEEGNLDEIKSYLNEENKLLERRMFYIKTGNSVADAVINTKSGIAKSKGIKFSVNADIENYITVNDVDLASMLGNLLDNAIEACENEDNSSIIVNIKEQKSFLIISISNTFTGEFSDKTKKKNKKIHGIGLNSVKRIVGKYDGELNIIQDDSMLTVKILIP